MPTASFITLNVGVGGSLVRTEQIVDSNSNTVQMEVQVIGDPSTAANLLTVDASGRITVNLASGSNVIGHVIVDSGTITTVGAVTAITNALPAGTNSLGSVSLNRVVQTAAAPAAATVGVTSAQVLASNSGRTGLLVVNTSGNWISLGIGAAAVLYSGITLAPNGGAFEMDGFTFSTAAITAIASGASSNLAIEELS